MALGAHAQNANTGGDLTMRFIKFMLAAVIAIGIVVAIAVNVPAVQDRLVDQAIRDNVDNRARIAKLFADDALRLVVCGSSSPLPSPDRARPCLAVIPGGHFYVVDTGSGDRKSVVYGKGGSVRVYLGGWTIIKQKKKHKATK